MSGGYDIAYLERNPCGADVASFRFEKPADYIFSPGQWFRLALDTSGGRLTQTFSHCSAPGDPCLELTTRLSGSAFKQALEALVPGQLVHVVGPGGHFVLPDSLERVAFLIGGVGITPVRSMLRDAKSRRRSFDDALLLYGNRDESCVPFQAELQDMADIGVRVVLCYERPAEDWTGERGFITAATVRGHLDIDSGRLFVVAGPPLMVTAMEHVLDDLGVPPERRLVERFG